MNYDSETERCTDCDTRRCCCLSEPKSVDDHYDRLDYYEQLEEEQMCSKEDNEYYNRDSYDSEPPAVGIFICDNCKEPDEVCKCPWCRWCGAGVEENVKLNKIKCPLDKCDGIGDEVCIECKNKHDRGHGL